MQQPAALITSAHAARPAELPTTRTLGQHRVFDPQTVSRLMSLAPAMWVSKGSAARVGDADRRGRHVVEITMVHRPRA
jgi:hypothetical protein